MVFGSTGPEIRVPPGTRNPNFSTRGNWVSSVAVKHYHNDNRVFKREYFTKSCSKDGQTQSFSGISEQHQNKEVEQAIQTVVSMVWEFMIHGVMSWGKDSRNELSLWPFALDHVAWSYNRVPQQNSELTRLEMATSNKSDHNDLLCTHVWGRPCYFLDSKLQNNKRLPR